MSENEGQVETKRENSRYLDDSRSTDRDPRDPRDSRDNRRHGRRNNDDNQMGEQEQGRNRDRNYRREKPEQTHFNSFREGPQSIHDLQSKGPGQATEIEYEQTKTMTQYTTFESMLLKPDLLKGLLQYGIIKPSNVQQRVMAPILTGRDVIAQAPSGTGKTTIFAIALLQIVDPSINNPQALAIFPTRELAHQARIAMKALGSYMNIKVHNCIGGTAQADDTRALESGVHIVTGTPGRIFDNIKRGILNTSQIKAWVIDEADEMFSKGFKDQVYYIYRYLPSDLQIMLVSATLPNDILQLTSKFMTDPVRILVKRDELSLQGIKQFFVNVESEEWKYETLIDLYELMTITQAVVFVNSREKCEEIAKKMQEANFTVDFMHGGMEQSQRDAVMTSFRSARSRVLITTDIWGRGIDVQQVSLVINYDLPQSRETYLHRIGRSGRFGRKGVAINFCKDDEKQVLDDIAQYYAIIIQEMPATMKEVVEDGAQ
jgi:ATP-dependent RNA helicase